MAKEYEDGLTMSEKVQRQSNEKRREFLRDVSKSVSKLNDREFFELVKYELLRRNIKNETFPNF